MPNIKNSLLILVAFGSVGCSQDEPVQVKDILYVELFGQCTDIEPPSSFKAMDTYQVDGIFGVRACNESCTSYGFLGVTKEEKLRRDELDLEVLMNDDIFILPTYERYKYYQAADIPFVTIYSISEEIYLQNNWQVDAYHSYIGGDDEMDNSYGINRAQCNLDVVKREGVITEEIRNKIDWCFDFDCMGDKIRKSRMTSRVKTLETKK